MAKNLNIYDSRRGQNYFGGSIRDCVAKRYPREKFLLTNKRCSTAS